MDPQSPPRRLGSPWDERWSDLGDMDTVSGLSRVRLRDPKADPASPTAAPEATLAAWWAARWQAWQARRSRPAPDQKKPSALGE